MNTTVKRSLVGIVFLIIMIGGMLYLYPVLFLLILIGMMEEFLRMTLGKKHPGIRIAAIVTAAVAFILCVLAGRDLLPVRWLGINAFTLLALLIFMITDHRDFKEYSYVFTALLYIALPLCLLPFFVERAGAMLLLSFFILIWVSDVGAYCFGMVFGQKIWPAKLCPEISPKKSWAGALGGLLVTLLAAYILQLLNLLPFSLAHVFILGTIMNVSGVFGDLFESLWKRQFGMKDSGTIMPGHGGLLDRFDSSLFAIPAGAFYLILNELV